MRETGQIHSALVPDGYAVELEYSAGGVFYRTNSEKYENKSEILEGKNSDPARAKAKNIGFIRDARFIDRTASIAVRGSAGNEIRAD